MYEEREQIAAHIKDDKIFFSGNSLLGGGEDIQVCPAKTLDTSPDEYYFDSDSCSGSARNAERRYGTFNRISHKLILSNSHELTEKNGDIWLVEGKFDCISLNPER